MKYKLVCHHCGTIFETDRASQDFCKDSCRKLSAKRREREQEAEASAATPPELRFCKCNGSSSPGHDEDGDPTCLTCGAAIEGGVRDRGKALGRDFSLCQWLMKMPPDRTLRFPTYFSKGERS